MDDVFDVNQSGADATSTPVEAELASLIDVRGASLVEQPAQLRLLLTQACPDAVRAIDAVIAASVCGVAGRLRAASDDASLPDLLTRCVQQVRKHGIDDPEWASWAVRTWAHAFALPTSGTPKAVAAPVATRAPFAPWRDAPHAPPAAPTIPAAATTTVAASIPASPRIEAASAPSDPAPASAEARFVEPKADAAARAADSSAEERLAPAFAEPVPPAIEPAPDLPLHEMPAASIEAVEPLPAAARLEPTSADAVAWSPSWAAAAPTRRNPRRAWIAVTAGIALIVLAAAYLALREPTPTPPVLASGPVTPAQEAPTPAQNVEPPAPASTAAATPPEPTPAPQSGPETVASSSPTVAAAETPSPRPSTAPSGVDANRPTETTAPATATATIPAADETPTPAPAPTPTPKSSTVARSIPASRPTITKIEAPRVVAGKPFVVMLRLAGDARGVAAVERRFFVSEGSWPQSGTVPVGSGLRRSGQSLLVWFRAPSAPARAAIEFVVVGRDGSHSEPKSVRITVVDAAPPATAVATAVATPVAACTAATCGAVVETREVETSAPADVRIYRITVRTDDRETHSFTAPYRLQIGTRVRLVGGRLVPMGASNR